MLCLNECLFCFIIQLETEKNKLENILNNNLTKKRERLQQDLREVSLEEQDKRLSGYKAEKIEVEKRVAELEAQTIGMNLFTLKSVGISFF